jgi:hypothetical protein
VWELEGPIPIVKRLKMLMDMLDIIARWVRIWQNLDLSCVFFDHNMLDMKIFF